MIYGLAGRRLITRAGFSLLETLVALSVIALATAVAVPALRRPSDAMRLDVIAREMIEVLRSVRARALFRAEGQDFRIDLDRLAYAATDAPAQPLPKDLRVKMTVAASQRGGRTGTIHFYPTGAATGAVIELRIGAHVARIDVNWLTGAAARRP